MILKQELLQNVIHITSEPGDATRYDFVVIKYFDDYIFAPLNSTFRFPQRINKFDVPEEIVWNNENVSAIAEKERCNPHTVVECMRTIKRLEEGGY